MLVSATTNAEIAKLDESHKATREQRVSQRTTRGTGPLAAFHQGLENLADGIYRPRHESFYDVLFEGLREYGYEEGRNLIVERRYARGQAERFKEFAAEMVRLNVDIIIVVTTPAALAVKTATTTIPIVHPNAIDPLNTGLIAKAANTLRRHQHLLCDSSCLIITVSEFR